MTDIEERRAKQRERNRRWREKHPITDVERAKRRAYYREKKEKEEEAGKRSTARHPNADPAKSKTKKERDAKRQTEIREDAEAKAMGISYGKYQMLKQQGMLPRYIPITRPDKPKKRGVYVPRQRGTSEFNASRERMFSVAANKIVEEQIGKRDRIRNGDNAVNNYMERMKKQREAVERATAGSSQSNS